MVKFHASEGREEEKTGTTHTRIGRDGCREKELPGEVSASQGRASTRRPNGGRELEEVDWCKVLLSNFA